MQCCKHQIARLLTNGQGEPDETGIDNSTGEEQTTATELPLTGANCTAPMLASGIRIHPQQASLIVAGQHDDVELAVNMVERLNTPRYQVLVEIFMVTVTRGFSCQLENIVYSATDSKQWK